jgi:Zn-dependent protease with chaperone function
MDFFDRQDQARRNTKLLSAYFIAGVAALTVAVYLAVAVIFAGINSSHDRYRGYEAERQQSALWNPQLFLGVAVGTLAVIGIGSAFKTLELAKGGSVVATNLGGRLVNPHTADPDQRKLLNVVEEMAIAAGIPVPQVYVLPEERGINAFAAGHSTSDAVVAVTQGAMKLLTRDELQGVIGHEFSHILNGDMRLNLRLMGIIFGIMCLAVIGRILLYTRSRSSKDKNPLPLLGLALLVIGGMGVFFGRLIQAAVSRQREFLADASAVQFTRNPGGLAGALRKIGGLSYGSRLQAPQATEATHLFFGNGVRESFLHIMDTHPPLAQRIRAIDPSFDGTFPRVSLAQLETTAPPAISATQRPAFPFLFPSTARAQAAVAGLAAPAFITAQTVLPALGNPSTAHLQYAEGLRASFPPSLPDAARDPMGASAMIYALLLSDNSDARSKQLGELTNRTSDAIVRETLRLLPEVQTLPAGAKLPLVDLALAGLRHLSPSQFQQFRGAVQTLVESDSEIELFEYVIQKTVLRHLEPHFFQARKPVVQFYALKPLAPDCSVLLSALAYVGQTEPDRIQFAFQRGAQALSYTAQTQLFLASADQCDLAQVDAALDRLSQAVPQIKKNVINACAQTVAADGVIQVTEAELLRAIADTLDCPIPPFIQSQ